MSIFSAEFAKQYWDRLPTQIPQKMIQGLIVGGTISFICGVGVSGAIAGGAMSAVATLVEALTRPFFQEIFPQNSFAAQFFHGFLSSLSGNRIVSTVSPTVGYICRGAERIGRQPLLAVILYWISFCSFNSAGWKNDNVAVSMI